MAPHSSTLAWKIPWAEGPGRLQSMGSLRVDKQVKTKDKGIPIKTVKTYSLGGYIRGRVKGSAADNGLLCGR